jgi:hypothetical protein
MARGIRLTKAERDTLRKLLSAQYVDLSCYGTRIVKDAASILAKVDASEETPKGVDVAPIEEALIAAARGKVIALEGGHARAAVMAASMKATPETATIVGAWMGRQGWLQGPQTLIDVLNKWYQWLPKARATEPPPALTPGLGTDATDGRGPAAAGQKAAGRRSTPGFR